MNCTTILMLNKDVYKDILVAYYQRQKIDFNNVQTVHKLAG